MKKILQTTMLLSLIVPALGFAVSPRPNSSITDPEMNSELNDPAINGYSEEIWEDDQYVPERMEEREEVQVIDYNDRPRTERERKALNTSSNASDDK